MNYLILDLEATCVEPRDPNFKNEIIEIGAVLVKNGSVIGKFGEFVKPTENKTLTPFCTSLTSITQEQVERAKTLDYVLGDLKLWLGEEHKIDCTRNSAPFTFCSWGDYDKNQLIRECRRKRIHYPFNENHCNVKIRFSRLFNCKPCGVDKAVQMLGWKFEGTHHRGIDDAINISKLFIETLKKRNV